MAKTKAKQPNKQTADASQPTGRQPLAEQPVGARRRVFWIGIADIPTICLTPFIAKYLAKKLQNVNSIDEMRA